MDFRDKITIKDEESWAEYASVQKELLKKCEVCRNSCDTENLRARHLAYQYPLSNNDMLILCKKCNYDFHLAEENNVHQIETLNDIYIDALRSIMRSYISSRAEIISDSIIIATGQYESERRPSIEKLFTHPLLNSEKAEDDEILIKLSKYLGIWNGHCANL